MNKIDKQTRGFLFGAITLGISVWDLTFNYGVYRTVFYHKIFIIWIASISLFLACIILPRHLLPLRTWGLLILIFPSLWVALGWIDLQNDMPIIGTAILAVLIIILVFCLPYMIYVIASITDPEIVDIPNKRLRYGLVLIAVIVGILGFSIGNYQDRFLTCHQFEVSGDYVPEKCHDPEQDQEEPSE